MTRCFLFGALLLVPAIPAWADSFASVHCDAAVQSGDWAGATVYCQQASEDYLTLASNQKGDARATSTVEAAIYLVDTGNADANTGDPAGADQKLNAARSLLHKAIGETHDSEIIGLANKTLTDMPPNP